jgi:sensor histidine kinase YesM
MRNPFSDRKFFAIYAIVWGLIIISQILILTLIVDLDFLSAFLQSIIQNGSFAALGFGIWYVVKYNISTERNIRAFLVFIISGLLIVIIWMGFNFVVENLIVKMSEGAIEFQRHHLYQFIIGVFLFSIFALSYRLLILLNNYNEKSKSEEKLKTLLTESKLNTLKAYINPHFLFNSINSVNALIATDPDKAREMLVNLSDYFRYSLKQKDINFISLEDELHYTFTYLEIEKLRFGDRIEVKIEMDENVKTTRLPVMILQPLFENVIKHAVSESLVTVHLSFTAKIEEGFLNMQLVNNYDPESVSRKGSGIGLSTTVERLNLIFGNKNLLNYSKRDGIFSVELKVPQQN